MTNNEAADLWNSSEPFENQSRPEPKARKAKPGTEAEIVLPETDEEFAPEPDTLGELIDGSEDDISYLEEQATPVPVASAVARDNRARVVAAVAAAAQKRSTAPMAETKTKVESIREEIARRKNAGEENIRPRDVIASLAERGVTVTAPQVSVALRNVTTSIVERNGKAPAKATKPTTAAEKPAKRVLARVTANAPTPAPAANGPSYAALEATAAFVQNNGGLETARTLLDAYARLFNPAG
jgi:hypothetical protein